MEKQPKKRWKRWCCGLPLLLIGLAAIGLVIATFVIEKKQTDRWASRNRPETYSEIFNTNFAPDYAVSAADEEKFNQKMIELLQKYASGTANHTESAGTQALRPLTVDEKITAATSDMQFLKNNYPEGYYLIVNSVLNTSDKDQYFPNFYIRADEAQSRIDLLVHELSHISSFLNLSFNRYGYVIEDKLIALNALNGLPKGDELIKYIAEPAVMDEKYLQDAQQNIYTTLDEIVSYTKSLRVARAYAYYQKGVINEDRVQALSRQLYFLSLQLRNIKEDHPNLWQKIKKEKGLIYFISREISIAKTEISAAKDEGASGTTGDANFASTVDKNLALFGASQALFDELFTAAGLDILGNLPNLSQSEISKLDIKIEKF